jgi:hypothetical protein
LTIRPSIHYNSASCGEVHIYLPAAFVELSDKEKHAQVERQPTSLERDSPLLVLAHGLKPGVISTE